MIIVLMGVTSSGKSTVGKMLAERLGWEFRDGDDFHPPANVAKMRSGQPLNDDDRKPWLEAIRAFMDHHHAAGGSAVVVCSALREAYRKVLGSGESWVRFVHLHGSKELIAERMRARKGHFMPPTLLDSQFNTLEPAAGALLVDVAPTPAEIVEEIVQRLGLAGARV